SKLNPTGSGLVYSTYLGVSGNISGATSIAVDAAGNAHVAGVTFSSTFPMVNPIQNHLIGKSDAFVTTLNAAGSSLLFSTYLGGNGGDDALGIAIDAAGNTFVAGISGSTNFPTTAGAYQTTWGGSQYQTGEGFVAEIVQSPGFAVVGFPSTTA